MKKIFIGCIIILFPISNLSAITIELSETDTQDFLILYSEFISEVRSEFSKLRNSSIEYMIIEDQELKIKSEYMIMKRLIKIRELIKTLKFNEEYLYKEDKNCNTFILLQGKTGNFYCVIPNLNNYLDEVFGIESIFIADVYLNGSKIMKDVLSEELITCELWSSRIGKHISGVKYIP